MVLLIAYALYFIPGTFISLEISPPTLLFVTLDLFTIFPLEGADIFASSIKDKKKEEHNSSHCNQHEKKKNLQTQNML